MEIKIFGKSLFSSTRGIDVFFGHAQSNLEKSKVLPDFYLGGSGSQFEASDYIELVPETFTNLTGASGGTKKKDKKKPKATKVADKAKLPTPKEIYDMKMLNDESFQLKTDEAYVDAQIEAFREKLSLLSKENYDMRNGIEEIESILIRMQNRKSYAGTAGFYDEYPYTLTTRISDLLKKHDYLKIGLIGQFIADLPDEATKAMKEYDSATEKLCGKRAVFYIIADKKDFEKTNSRRDPILLAQSPFGHFWQILGAWDKEMMLLEEL